MKKRIAIVCANGIGDALLFLGLRKGLELLGYEAVLFSSAIESLGSWIQGHSIQPQPKDPKTLFTEYDALFLQHDNSLKAKELEKFSNQLFCFYGAYQKDKHPPFRQGYDYVCNSEETMLTNIKKAAKLFFRIEPEKEHLLTPSSHLIHRSYKKRVLIHPTGSTLEKRWPKEKFLTLFHLLKKEGLDPRWIVDPSEAKEWKGAKTFPTLSDLADYIYESSYMIGNDSGPGHLASLLQIPSLIIGGDGLNMPLWKPDWYSAELITSPHFWMRYKALRKRWHFFIRTKKVLKTFNNKVLNNDNYF